MVEQSSTVKDAERAHGKWLKENDPVLIWGWGTPAGQLRAARRAELIVKGACLAPGKRALEVGCGTGMFTEMFAQSGASILAVDISGDLLELARERKLNPERVTFLEAPFEDCGLHGPFDAVIGSSILHHLDCGQALPKIYALLKPGGMFSFCEPNMRNPQLWFTLRHRRFFKYISPGETAFYKEQMEEMLRQSGFTDVQVIPFDWLHPKTPKSCIPLVKKAERFFEAHSSLNAYAGSLWCTARRPLG